MKKKYLYASLPVIIFAIIMGILLIIMSCYTNLNVKYIAHRGHGYIDNTEQAFLNSNDYWGIECDVRVSKDQKLVLNHDEEVIFASGEKYDISKTTSDILFSKQLKNKQYLCSLQKYLQICKTLEKTAVIEIKSTFTDEQTDLLLNQIKSYYSENNCVIISFKKENLLKVKEKSNIELHYLFNGDNKQEKINFCIQNNINASIQYVYIKSEDVKLLHENNLKVGAWTVNYLPGNYRLKKLNIDYITSDKFWK